MSQSSTKPLDPSFHYGPHSYQWDSVRDVSGPVCVRPILDTYPICTMNHFLYAVEVDAVRVRHWYIFDMRESKAFHRYMHDWAVDGFGRTIYRPTPNRYGHSGYILLYADGDVAYMNRSGRTTFSFNDPNIGLRFQQLSLEEVDGDALSR